MNENFENIAPNQYAIIARAIFGKPNRNPNNTKTLDKEIYCSLIGCSYIVCSELWNMIQPRAHTDEKFKGYHPKHLLWALLFLKCYCTLPVLSRLVGGVEDSEFSTWAWLFVRAIHDLKPRVVSEHD